MPKLSKKRHRSPAYPAVDLEGAIKLVDKVYPSARNPLGADVIAEEWGYSSQLTAAPYIAAAKYYGLLTEEKDAGGDRVLKLTPLSEDILVDPDGETSEREEAIKKAAVMPSLHHELYTKWSMPLPPDGEIRRYLLRERKFNPKRVDRFIETFRATIAFAKLSGSDIIEGEEADENQGDPVNAIVAEPPKPDNQPQPVAPPAKGVRQDVFTLDRGRVVLERPTQLTADDYEDIEEWTKLVLRKIKRSIVEDEPKEEWEDEE